MMEHKTIQFSRLALQLSRVDLFDMAKQDFARDIAKRGLLVGDIHWTEPMESRYACRPFEHIKQVMFYAEVSPEPTRQPRETHSHNEVTNAE